MTEGITLAAIVELITQYGTLGVLVAVWWSDRKEAKAASERMASVLAQYKRDMIEAREMYENNVKLVKNYESVAGDLKEVVIMNTQAVTQLCVDIQTNQFCPNVRLEKQAKGVQG